MPRNAVTKVKRGKAGKGKKEGKQETKAVKESDVEKAKASAALWELRLRATEQTLAEYREDCRALARANEQLTSQLYRAEKDWLDITGFLKRQDAAKEEKIRALQRNLQTQDRLAREEQNKLVDEYTTKINEMKELFRKKSRDFYLVQEGMKKIDEFQKRKAEMEQELSDMKENMDDAEKEHKENLNKMEFKFFQEKSRLEREAEQRIALVEERAHSEAIVQLDDTSRSVFKENVRLNEALKYHIKEALQLQTLTHSMAKENASMALDKNTYELIVKDNTAQMEAQRKELSKLRAKEASLEQALKLKAGEPEREEEKAKASLRVHAAGQQELEEFRKALCLRERELGHVKRLANAVVEQRSELEQFFHQGMAQVKQEISASRSRYKKEALQAYRWRMREATAGRLTFPPIRTFQKGPRSTNSVYSDMEEADSWTHPPGSNVEISDLTWEQKEQVLRLLFAKMNGRSERNACQHLALSASSEKRLIDIDVPGIREQLSPATFITQAPEPVLPSNRSSLPDIRTA